MVTDSQNYATLVVPTNFYYFVSDVTDAVHVVRALVEDLRRDADSNTEPSRAARRPHELLPLSSHVAALGALRVLASTTLFHSLALSLYHVYPFPFVSTDCLPPTS
jgi:hypothetical protein